MIPVLGVVIVLILVIFFYYFALLVFIGLGIGVGIGLGTELIKDGGKEPYTGDINVIKTRLYMDNLNFRKYLQNAIEGIPTALYLSDIQNSLPYESYQDDVVRSNIHIGQLKLFLTELELLTETLKSNTEDVIMVYAGSAPCHHASYLSDMFPNLKIVMIDPNEHYIFYKNKGTSYDSKNYKETVYFKLADGNKFNVKERNIQLYSNGSVTKCDRKDNQKVKKNNDEFDQHLKNNEFKQILDFIKKTKYKYYIIEDYFMDITADLFSGFEKESNFIFCSDLRSNINSSAPTKSVQGEDTEMPGDTDLLWNLAMQYNWLNKMNPTKCMLKFRCPFFGGKDKNILLSNAYKSPYRETFEQSKSLGIDFVDDYKRKKFRYIMPDHIYLQAFAGENSTESRLVASKNKYNIVDLFDSSDYENKYFYYNRVERSYGYHEHEYDKDMGFDACGDCGIMFTLFKKYNEKFAKKQNEIKQINELMHVLKRNLKEHGSLHGKYLKKYKNVQTVIDQQNSFISYGIYKYNADLLDRSAIVIE